MPVQQTTLSIRPKPRGFHLITRDIEQALQQFGKVEAGLLHVFIQHTSASLTINEDADPSVRQDFESHFNHMVPENAPYYLHTDEGPDDMPAHLKASLLGSSVTLPVTDGRLNVGTWQGVYLCEHRNHAGARRLVLTLTS
ncbi:MAG: secondary thiamine-phosphate synthase enzyme YjbQ [Firmicutes bacterium]|nr:secondary thiamine-phosphate synthase enzyme YjbQ [Bacillota bacterium]